MEEKIDLTNDIKRQDNFEITVDYLEDLIVHAESILQLIRMIGCDYDGYNTVEDLKREIDELCSYATDIEELFAKRKELLKEDNEATTKNSIEKCIETIGFDLVNRASDIAKDLRDIKQITIHADLEPFALVDYQVIKTYGTLASTCHIDESNPEEIKKNLKFKY